MIRNETLQNLKQFLTEIKVKLPASRQILTGGGSLSELVRFNQAALVFNRRIHEKPYVIVYCETEADVQATYKTAIKNNLAVRIRAGGHDHEGECSGTNTILIDVSKLNTVHIDCDTKLAKIGPGNRFIKLTTDLANEDVMIPHGTCATVGIAGFTMGGGWGPWTRKKGMCCEYLMGATLVLGDGSTVEVDAKGADIPDLLWALRGGGGMSYGLVTEFRIQTFELPPKLIKFDLIWNAYNPFKPDELTNTHPTIQILKAWEKVIESSETSQLIGTNLKINGKPLDPEHRFDWETVNHNCVMYGYWEGEQEGLDNFIKTWFSDIMPDQYIPEGQGGSGNETSKPYGARLMSSWDRESHHNIRLLAQGANGAPIPPDLDTPAPHKITSRFVNKVGLGDTGYEALLSSLTSPLILDGNRDLGLFTYVTLGAITGDYYQKNPEGANSSFPYKDKLYTIQYQTWWNDAEKEKQEGEDNFVYDRTNRALDWMEVARDYDIPNTSGAFISFKDSSIPTKTYFAQNYDRLIEIKKNNSKDSYNHLRIRKSII